jgi:23S rRNA pseudouridine1911/1915/1917 synthase
MNENKLNNILEIRVSALQVGTRLDKVVASCEEEISRTKAEKLIDDGLITVNGKVQRQAYKVLENDLIVINLPQKQEFSTAEASDIELNIVFEDEDIIVIDKPQGLVVHPAPGHHGDTLVNALLHHTGSLSQVGGPERPGIVHRIDKDTSGLIVAAKNDSAHRNLSAQLADRTMHREYMALVHGSFGELDGKIDAPIGRDKKNRQIMAVDSYSGKEAVTFFHVEKRYDGFTLLSCRLLTGRTHQIRVHLSFIHHPVAGDPVYGKGKLKFRTKGQLLHAYKLILTHPRSGEKMEFISKLPDYFQNVLKNLKEI